MGAIELSVDLVHVKFLIQKNLSGQTLVRQSKCLRPYNSGNAGSVFPDDSPDIRAYYTPSVGYNSKLLEKIRQAEISPGFPVVRGRFAAGNPLCNNQNTPVGWCDAPPAYASRTGVAIINHHDGALCHNHSNLQDTAWPGMIMNAGNTRLRDSRLHIKLPDIDQLPESDIVIYDGQCRFCQAQVARLNWFGGGRLRFVSLHDERVAARFPELSREQLMKQMFVVTPDGHRYGGATALRYLSRRLPRLWFAAPFLHIPFSLPIWQWLYGLIARYRYQIAGKSGRCEGDACEIHIGEQRKS